MPILTDFVHPQPHIREGFIDGFVLCCEIAEVVVAHYDHPFALLRGLLHTLYLVLPEFLIAGQALIVHAADHNIAAGVLNQLGEEHAPALAGFLEGVLVEPAPVLGEDEGVVPAHGEQAAVVAPHPALLGHGEQQLHELLGHLLQAYEIRLAGLQESEDALEPGRLVVVLEPDIVGQHGQTLRQLVELELVIG